MQPCVLSTLGSSVRVAAWAHMALHSRLQFVANKLHRIDNKEVDGVAAAAAASHDNTEYGPSECRSILTEVEKLLHGEGRRGEFGEVLDVFGHAGQRRVLHDKPDELHCRCGETRLR